jgi:hypothetical protein
MAADLQTKRPRTMQPAEGLDQRLAAARDGSRDVPLASG